MFNKKVVLAVISLVCLTSFSFAQSCGGKKVQNKKCPIMKKVCKILKNGEAIGLSQTEIQKIKNTKREVKKKQIKLNAEIEILGLDIKNAFHQETINTSEINRLIDKKFEFKKERVKIAVAAYAKINNMLSQEQKTKLKALPNPEKNSIPKKCKKKKQQCSKDEKGYKCNTNIRHR
ncbi:MAG: hypothetical protein GY817_06370 [bacterium]|nr:hypothetical protein [bacterium]